MNDDIRRRYRAAAAWAAVEAVQRRHRDRTPIPFTVKDADELVRDRLGLRPGQVTTVAELRRVGLAF